MLLVYNNSYFKYFSILHEYIYFDYVLYLDISFFLLIYRYLYILETPVCCFEAYIINPFHITVSQYL